MPWKLAQSPLSMTTANSVSKSTAGALPGNQNEFQAGAFVNTATTGGWSAGIVTAAATRSGGAIRGEAAGASAPLVSTTTERGSDEYVVPFRSTSAMSE